MAFPAGFLIQISVSLAGRRFPLKEAVPAFIHGHIKMTASGVRVRIAPSPTGEPHVGTAYIALFNYLLPRSTAASSSCASRTPMRRARRPNSRQKVLDALKWCGLKWSEGPDIGGPYGPYRQSDRKDIYRPSSTRSLPTATASAVSARPSGWKRCAKPSAPPASRRNMTATA